MKEFFGLGDEWARPLPRGWLRRDALGAVVVFVCAVLGLEVMRSLGIGGVTWARWALYAASFLGALPLVWRRRFPVAVMLLSALHMFVFGLTQIVVMGNLAMQAAYFFAIFTAAAWGRDRLVAAYATGGVVLFMFGWVAVQLSIAALHDDLLDRYGGIEHVDRASVLLGPVTAAVLSSVMTNILFFVAAVATGANSWRGARSRARAQEQARTIEAQAEQLTERAVVEERLRIARELHDVVAHHVAAIGIQAAAARKVMTKNPEAATTALTHVEASSRDAVTQMRALLGTLRADSASRAQQGCAGDDARRPEPRLADIDALVDHVRAGGFAVRYDNLVGAGAHVPEALQHSLFRTVQEALANVRRHSTATSATVTLRSGGDGAHAYVEAEILDDGRPRAGTSGSGLGLLGLRERVTAHRGVVEVGPRLTGGYRVRVRLPLTPPVACEKESR